MQNEINVDPYKLASKINNHYKNLPPIEVIQTAVEEHKIYAGKYAYAFICQMVDDANALRATLANLHAEIAGLKEEIMNQRYAKSRFISQIGPP